MLVDPVVSSHFSPGAAPQVGQRIMSAFFGSEFFFHGEIMRRSRLVRMSILTAERGFFGGFAFDLFLPELFRERKGDSKRESQNRALIAIWA